MAVVFNLWLPSISMVLIMTKKGKWSWMLFTFASLRRISRGHRCIGSFQIHHQSWYFMKAHKLNREPVYSSSNSIRHFSANLLRFRWKNIKREAWFLAKLHGSGTRRWPGIFYLPWCVVQQAVCCCCHSSRWASLFTLDSVYPTLFVYRQKSPNIDRI